MGKEQRDFASHYFSMMLDGSSDVVWTTMTTIDCFDYDFDAIMRCVYVLWAEKMIAGRRPS